MTQATTIRCSDVAVEPLPGSAKQATIYVIFEWTRAWSRDVLDGDTFGQELTAKLKAHLDEAGATLQLIRQPTREGRNIDNHHLYIVFAEHGTIEVLHVDGPEAILDLDLSAPLRCGGVERTRPLLLVCTHAKRDACCAIKGRPLVAELEQRFPSADNGDVIWETSHTKGHRFAPSTLLMPWGYSFGRMNVEATTAMVEAARNGEYFIPGNRGRGTLSPTSQVAEIAVAKELARTGRHVNYGQLRIIDEEVEPDAGAATVAVNDSRAGVAYRVILNTRTVDGVISSCGKNPQPGEVWDVVSVHALGCENNEDRR
ncbi:sucrase ferredoxin [Corynebacterium cystitidis]|uniref:sucrase ferredoxin n=1 Tax=Corynebacterium cystitidis TaxID=35757 RepID=UPI00211F0AEE|nr:sucrase ferredoxin [Corynebacterium cystitidis]